MWLDPEQCNRGLPLPQWRPSPAHFLPDSGAAKEPILMKTQMIKTQQLHVKEREAPSWRRLHNWKWGSGPRGEEGNGGFWGRVWSLRPSKVRPSAVTWQLLLCGTYPCLWTLWICDGDELIRQGEEKKQRKEATKWWIMQNRNSTSAVGGFCNLGDAQNFGFI